MAFQHAEYTRKYLEHAGTNDIAINDAAQYEVRVVPTTVSAGQTYWRIIGIHHLTPEENHSRHNAYVEAIDENGRRLKDARLRIGWTWEGRQGDEAVQPKPLDKPDSEPAGDVPIEHGMNLELWIEGDGLASDHVQNIHYRHDDEPAANGELWNSFGHHSFYVVFQRTAHSNEGDSSGDSGATQEPDQKDNSGSNVKEPQTEQPFPNVLSAARKFAFKLKQVKAAQKIGIDANAPINPQSGAIQPQVADPAIIADTGAGWVRLNFILGQKWSSPSDSATPQGLTWFQTYRRIIDQYRARGLRIYGLISSEAVSTDPGDTMREPPPSGQADHWWIPQYVDNFVAILEHFKDDLSVVESFNEPDDWHGGNRSWIDPGWFAIMLERLYQEVEKRPHLSHIRVVSGPLQGLGHNNNNAANYLDQAYAAGSVRYGWNQEGKRFPFDGIGYHLYVEEGLQSDPVKQEAAIRNTYDRYLGQMKSVIIKHEGAMRPLYISEMGWFSNGDNRDTRERFQAESLKTGLRLLLENDSIALAVQFCTQDFDAGTNDKYYGLYRTGSLDTSNRKLAFTSFRNLCEQVLELPVLTDEEIVGEDLLPFGAQKVTEWIGQVTAELGLFLRQGPSSANAIIQPLPYNTEVRVQGAKDEWLYIQTLGRLGFAHGSFIAKKTVEPVITGAGYLRERLPLVQAELAPATADLIPSSAAATWTDHAVARSWNHYGGLLGPIAEELQLDPAVAASVLAIESGGRAFGASGRMIIRFESHIFYNRWGIQEPERFAQHFQVNPDQPWDGESHRWRPDPHGAWQSFHGDQVAEWLVFSFARTQFNDEAAKMSISMGAPQIMGFNHAAVGYQDASFMYDAFESHPQRENLQIIGLFDFIRAASTRIEALQRGDFRTFAASYNGTGAAERYDNLLQDGIAAYRRLRQQPEAVAMDVPESVAVGSFDAAALSFALPGEMTAVEGIDQTPEPDAMPIPEPPFTADGKALSETDPELYAAWRDHVIQGYDNNSVMFKRILEGFMAPYRSTVRMYYILFGVGVAAFVAAAVIGVWTGQATFALIFGGLSALAFLAFFLSRPLQALEENLQFITWLGIVYNSYWTRLAHANDAQTFQQEVEDATENAIRDIKDLLDEHGERSRRRPGPGR